MPIKATINIFWQTDKIKTQFRHQDEPIVPRGDGSIDVKGGEVEGMKRLERRGF
jgi:hypothetical protein